MTAAAVDTSTQFSRRLPWVIGGVVLLSFLLLMAVFRSLAVPLKAAVMNLLSVGAAYGVIVAVFQWGWLGSFFDIGKTGPIDPWIPLMLFTILFGLSMDYEVFLLTRIREEWRRTGDNATAVADGLASPAGSSPPRRRSWSASSARSCSATCAVLKVFGLGLAVAVFVDATPGALGARAGHDGAARPGQLVVPGVARPDRPARQRRGRGRGRRGDRRPGRPGP